MSFRDRIFRYREQKQVRKPAQFRNYSTIKSVLLIFESDLIERNLQVKQLIKELQQDGKEVTAWGYVNKKDRQTPVLRDFRVFGTKEITLTHRPEQSLREELERMHFDLLIDLTSDFTLLPLRYLALYADADFKTGRGGYDAPYFHDLLIDLKPTDDDAAFLFDQILHYLKTINS